MSRLANAGNDPELPILEALEQEPSLSQRALAQRAGLSVTKAHFLLRRLVEKGLVKVHNVANSRHKMGYAYLLTPRGLEVKARLAYAFLQRVAHEYQEITLRVERSLEKAIPDEALALHRPVQVGVAGGGPLSEVVCHRLRGRVDAILVGELAEADMVVVTHPDAVFTPRPGLRVVHLG